MQENEDQYCQYIQNICIHLNIYQGKAIWHVNASLQSIEFKYECKFESTDISNYVNMMKLSEAKKFNSTIFDIILMFCYTLTFN